MDDGQGDAVGADGGDTEPAGPPGVLEQMANTITNAVLAPTRASDAALQMIASMEGFSATPYADHKGYSIGYGHLIKPGESFTLIDEAQALDLMRSDVGIAERAVSAAVSASLTQQQFDALVSLAYNIGAGPFKSSTLVRLLNEGDYAGAAAQFQRWNIAGGEVNGALVRRRITEEALFSGGTYV
jgi:GH24 family phage-related lysozyme (muramidase)